MPCCCACLGVLVAILIPFLVWFFRMPCKKEEVSADGRKRRFWSDATVDDVVKGLDLKGKTILVTGTTNGIGVETARALAVQGAHLVMVNRNKEASEKLRNEIYSETSHRNIDIITCDLMSLKSVKEAADQFIKKGWPLHVLLLNAGVSSPPVRATKDGYNSTFGVNHLAHFYLTHLLKDRLISSAPSRVVVLSSDLYRHHRVDSKLPLDKKLALLIPGPDTDQMGMTQYMRSKFCNVLFTLKLHRELHEKGVNVNCIHPGVISSTGLMNLGGPIVKSLMGNFSKTVKQGAACSTYVAVHPDVKNVSGHYFENCWDDPSLLKKEAKDEVLQDALWDRSLEMIKKAV